MSMAAVVLAIGSGGALSSLETTVLLTVDETVEALRKAQQVQYPSAWRVAVLTRRHRPSRLAARRDRAFAMPLPPRRPLLDLPRRIPGSASSPRDHERRHARGLRRRGRLGQGTAAARSLRSAPPQVSYQGPDPAADGPWPLRVEALRRNPRARSGRSRAATPSGQFECTPVELTKASSRATAAPASPSSDAKPAPERRTRHPGRSTSVRDPSFSASLRWKQMRARTRAFSSSRPLLPDDCREPCGDFRHPDGVKRCLRVLLRPLDDRCDPSALDVVVVGDLLVGRLWRLRPRALQRLPEDLEQRVLRHGDVRPSWCSTRGVGRVALGARRGAHAACRVERTSSRTSWRCRVTDPGARPRATIGHIGAPLLEFAKERGVELGEPGWSSATARTIASRSNGPNVT